MGPAQCALDEFAALSRDYEVYMIERGPREPVSYPYSPEEAIS